MYTCHNPATMDVYRFRSIDALVRRLGGTHYSADHETGYYHETRTITVLRDVSRGAESQSQVICALRVPVAALEDSELRVGRL